MNKEPPLMRLYKRNPASGLAIMEMALVVPFLVVLALPVVDYGRNMQVQAALNGMAREGANMASRSAQTSSMQTIMDTVVSTAPSLDMAANGMIHITELQGDTPCDSGTSRCHAKVIQQFRWNGGHLSSAIHAWNGCGSAWAADGHCSMPSVAPDANVLQKQLSQGQVAYVVEVSYNHPPLFGSWSFAGVSLPALPSLIHAEAIF
jgi:hypothetical protein